MNNEQWASIIRTVLLLVIGPGSYLVLKGVLTEDQANQLIPILVPLIIAAGGAIVGKLAVNAHSARAVVAAVNSPSVPGVKAVASTSRK